MTAADFSKHMKKVMLENGWSEIEADKIVSRAMAAHTQNRRVDNEVD